LAAIKDGRCREGPGVLVELGVVEQRYRAVLEVLEEGLPVTEVARRYGVARQTVHEWLSRYANGGLGGLTDRSPRWRRRWSACGAIIRGGGRRMQRPDLDIFTLVQRLYPGRSRMLHRIIDSVP
jgi:helix-turn-helix protein